MTIHEVNEVNSGGSFFKSTTGTTEQNEPGPVVVPSDSDPIDRSRIYIPDTGPLGCRLTPPNPINDKLTNGEPDSGLDGTEPCEIVDDRCDSAASVSCEYLIYRPPDPLVNRHSYTDTRIAEIKLFWIDSQRSPTASVPLSLDERGRLVVQLVTSYAPPTEPAWVLPTHTSPTGESNEDDSAAGRLKDAFADYAAKKLVDPTWEKSVERWETPEYENLASAVENFSELHDQLHHLVVGESIQSLTGLKPLADIAAEVALPGDSLITSAKCLVEGIGILLGLISGQPLIANACLKLLAHDLIVKVVHKKIRDSFTNHD